MILKNMDTDKELKPTEFSALVSLMIEQDKRTMLKLSEMHDHIKETKGDVKLINGRLRGVEGEVVIIEKELEDIRPTKPVLKHFSMFMKHPKKVIALLFVIIIAIQALVLEAMEHNWLGELIKFIKP
jgi:hypothetical protein